MVRGFAGFALRSCRICFEDLPCGFEDLQDVQDLICRTCLVDLRICGMCLGLQDFVRGLAVRICFEDLLWGFEDVLDLQDLLELQSRPCNWRAGLAIPADPAIQPFQNIQQLDGFAGFAGIAGPPALQLQDWPGNSSTSSNFSNSSKPSILLDLADWLVFAGIAGPAL